jgi:hypothetical protein
LTTVAADVRIAMGIAPVLWRRPIILRTFCTVFRFSPVSATILLLSASLLRTAWPLDSLCVGYPGHVEYFLHGRWLLGWRQRGLSWRSCLRLNDWRSSRGAARLVKDASRIRSLSVHFSLWESCLGMFPSWDSRPLPTWE